MSGKKLSLCIQTVKFLLTQLKSTDRLSLVSYDTDVRSDFGLTLMNDAGKKIATAALDKLRAGSMTNLSGGLMQSVKNLGPPTQGCSSDAIRSILLLTDGLANHGITATAPLVKLLQDGLEHA